MIRTPTYLRAVATTACPLKCDYCHREGDPQGDGGAQLETEVFGGLLHVAVDAGMHKVKFLGGEPLVRKDLPKIVRSLRARHPDIDLSVITSGVVDPDRAMALFDAGLSRMNVSIHGFLADAFARRGGTVAQLGRRGHLVDRLVEQRRFPKLNYVYSSPADDLDLGAFLDWAADRPVLTSVLDNLGDPAASAETVLGAVQRLRGPWEQAWDERDPHSLPTRRFRWRDGLQVEIKTSRLGDLAPWAACRTCPQRARCREGIFALRLTHDGRLQGCMDRPDLSVDLRAALEQGHEAALAAFLGFTDRLQRVPRPNRRFLPVVGAVPNHEAL